LDARSSPAAGTSEAELRRQVEHYERWARLLDGQIRVLERERQKLTTWKEQREVLTRKRELLGCS
jgi:U3 small nucleolar ribonucleoprotein component